MMIVPENKTIYIGARRYCEGEVLPPHIAIEMPVMTKEAAEAKAKAEEDERLKQTKKSKNKPSFSSSFGNKGSSSFGNKGIDD